MKKIIFVIVAIIIAIVICISVTVFFILGEPRPIIQKTVANFDECAAAGNPVMESYPRQCRANGKNFVEQINKAVACTPDQRNAQVCAQIYSPVCAKVNIQCIKAPCNPIFETFSNACEACKNSLVENYTLGACQQDQGQQNGNGILPYDSGIR